MTPETGEHLGKAREYLVKARALLDVVHFADEAGRAVYLAAFHAAQALISEKTGKIAKTHEGVNRQFNALTKDDPRVDRELRRFLSQAYSLKAVADYEAGPGAEVPVERVESALAVAHKFVELRGGTVVVMRRCVLSRFSDHRARPSLQVRRALHPRSE